MNENLSALIADTKSITKKVEDVFSKLTVGQLNWKPNAKSWSIGQCLVHLIITNNLYFPNIQKVIDGNHQNNLFSKIPFSTNLIAALMKNSLKPEQARKMKTFKIFEPAISDVSSTIFDDFAENNRKLIAMIEACKGLELHKIKIAEPLSVALNLRLNDVFEILAMHEKRHFLQAERVMKMEVFPK